MFKPSLRAFKTSPLLQKMLSFKYLGLLLLHFAWVRAYFYPLLLPLNSSFSSNFRLGFVKKVMVCCHQVFNNYWPQKNFPKEEFICCKNQTVKKTDCCLWICLYQRKSQSKFNFYTLAKWKLDRVFILVFQKNWADLS